MTTPRPNKFAQELKEFYQNTGRIPKSINDTREGKLARQYWSTRKALWKVKGNLDKASPSVRNTVNAAPEFYADITDYFEVKKDPTHDLWFFFSCLRLEIQEEEEKLAALGDRLIELAHAHALGQSSEEDFTQAQAQLEAIRIPEGIPGMTPSIRLLKETDSLLQIAHLLLAGADALRHAMRTLVQPEKPSIITAPF